jgi:hypothetical protein
LGVGAQIRPAGLATLAEHAPALLPPPPARRSGEEEEDGDNNPPFGESKKWNEKERKSDHGQFT